MRPLRLVLLAAILAAPLLTASSALAEVRVVGSAGELYELRSGTFSRLFPESPSIDPAASVLALDIWRAETGLQRILVPGTEDLAPEADWSLIWERSINQPLLFWRAATVGDETSIFLARFAETGVLVPEQIALGRGRPLRFFVTTDRFAEIPAVVGAVHSRIVAHGLWLDHLLGNLYLLRYETAVIVDGRLVGRNAETPYLPGLSPAPLDGVSPLTPEAVVAAFSLTEGREVGRFSFSTLDPFSRALVSYQVQVLPGELGQLGDKARGHIIDLAGNLGAGVPAAEVAEQARAAVLSLSQGFAASAAVQAADVTKALILAADPAGDPNVLADKARGHIIDLTAPVVRGGLFDEPTALAESVFEIADSTSVAGGFHHLIRVRQVGARPLPSDVPEGAEILTSPRGSGIIVCWQSAEGSLAYYESRGGEWSPRRQFPLAGAGIELAREILRASLGSD